MMGGLPFALHAYDGGIALPARRTWSILVGLALTLYMPQMSAVSFVCYLPLLTLNCKTIAPSPTNIKP